MKLAKTLACTAAALCFAAGSAWAGDSSSSPSGQGATADPSFEEQGALILLEPVEVQDLYAVDEDGDGLADYLVLEDPDLIALFGDEEDAATGAY
jgi:hypothetical protein